MSEIKGKVIAIRRSDPHVGLPERQAVRSVRSFLRHRGLRSGGERPQKSAGPWLFSTLSQNIPPYDL
jgi:hypothetical protein